MARRRTLVKKRRRRTNKRRTMRRRRTINKMRGGGNEAQRIKTELFKYDNTKTHGRAEGQDAMMQALEKHIKLLNKSPYTVIIPGAYTTGTITNDGSKLTYSNDDKYASDYACTIDELNAILPPVTPKVEKHGTAITPDIDTNYGLRKQFEETI
jgi:hypothetical protein